METLRRLEVRVADGVAGRVGLDAEARVCILPRRETEARAHVVGEALIVRGELLFRVRRRVLRGDLHRALDPGARRHRPEIPDPAREHLLAHLARSRVLASGRALEALFVALRARGPARVSSGEIELQLLLLIRRRLGGLLRVIERQGIEAGDGLPLVEALLPFRRRRCQRQVLVGRGREVIGRLRLRSGLRLHRAGEQQGDQHRLRARRFEL